jgi:5-methylcytosine-specific restriction endonuclease McrA
MSVIVKEKVLLLNKNWQAIKIIPLKKAITLLSSDHFAPKAKVIDPRDFVQYDWNDWSKITPDEGELFIKSCNSIHKVPELILLTKYDRLPVKLSGKFSRRMLFKRDENTCQYCNKEFSTEELTIDHVHPRSKGGITVWDNCVACCIACNTKKASKTLAECGFKLKKKPVKPDIQKLSEMEKVPFSFKDSWKNFLSNQYWDALLED